MVDDELRVIRRANASVLKRIAGVPRSPATIESDRDPRNPFRSAATNQPCDAADSEPGSSAGSDHAPPQGGPRLRLVWSARQ